MGRTRFAGGVAPTSGACRRFYSQRISAQQRIHLAAFLIAAACSPLLGQDIAFDPATTDAEFARFSRVVAQAIFPTPVSAARAAGVIHFDAGIAATAVKVDDTASYWRHAVSKDFTTHGYVGVPRLVVSKGFGAGTISGSYAKVSDSGIKSWGGALDLPILRGGVTIPEIALRGSYGMISGSDALDAKVYGLEAFVSKGFGPLTPYAAIGRMRVSTTGNISAIVGITGRRLGYRGDINRLTAGATVSLLAPRLSVEITKAEVTSYAAKVSIGF